MVDLAYVIAGSEATGGAGIQADLRTFQQLGTFGLGTVTCLVSFDPAHDWNHRFFPVPAEVIAQQMEAATAAYDLDVVKIGMLGTPATIDVVAEGLRGQRWRHVVLDPVLICKGQEPGAALDTDNALREQVVPLATVVTPNLFETHALSGMASIETVEQLTEAARRIQELGPRVVVAKGGVDLPGHREPPGPDEPNHGLYVHKASFGARWVVRTPARRLVVRPTAVRVADARDEVVGLGRRVMAGLPGRHR